MATAGLVLAVLSLSAKVADEVTMLIGDEPVKGVILQFDEEGFTFRPADVTTPVYLSWHTLSLSERKRVKGLIGFGPEEELDDTPVDKVDGVVLQLRSGLKLKGVLLPERETPDAVYIKTRHTPYFEVQKSAILSSEKKRLPETEVYSLDELYDLKIGEIRPETARDHFEMVRWCMKVELYEKARDHLVRCTIIDPLYEERTEGMLAEIKLRVKEHQARGLYDAILRANAAADYDEAIRLTGQLQAAYPDSMYTTEATFTLPEIQARKKRVLRTSLVRAGYSKLAELIRRRVRNRIPDGEQIMGILVQLKSGEGVKGRLIEENDQLVVLEKGNNTYNIARDQILDMKPVPLYPVRLRDTTFTECKDYVTDDEGGISADLMAALSGQFRTSEEEVRDIWENRARRTINIGGRTKVDSPAAHLKEASYGEGTWLREGSGVERYSIDFKTSTSTRRVRNAYRRWVTVEDKSTTVDVRGAESGELEQDVDRWWARLGRERRYRILKAICADAIMDVEKVFKDGCPQCGGKGYKMVHSMTGYSMQRTCSRCRALGYSIRLLYR